MKIRIESIWRVSRCTVVGGHKHLEGTLCPYFPGRIRVYRVGKSRFTVV